MANALKDGLGHKRNRIDQIRLGAALAVVFGHSCTSHWALRLPRRWNMSWAWAFMSWPCMCSSSCPGF